MTEDHQAWNNFVLLGDAMSTHLEEGFRSAAIANLYMGGVNNGGINSFLTSTYELGGADVVSSLKNVGAHRAAEQLEQILSDLGEPLIPSSQEERWELLDRCWPEEWDDFVELDTLAKEADEELMVMLMQHVSAHKSYYLALY